MSARPSRSKKMTTFFGLRHLRLAALSKARRLLTATMASSRILKLGPMYAIALAPVVPALSPLFLIAHRPSLIDL